MKNNKQRKTNSLNAFAVMLVVVSLAAAVILILHNSYGFFA